MSPLHATISNKADSGAASRAADVWHGQSRRVRVQEVGMRDGLQIEQAFVPTAEKIALVDALSAAGLRKIEVTAFVSPKAIPSLRDAEEVFRGITKAPGCTYSALVPNVRGAERAIAAGADELNLVMSVTETHNLANLRMLREQSFAGLRQVIDTVGGAVSVSVSLSCCFGCPMEGDVSPGQVFDWVQRFADLGVVGISLCDTTGMAYPSQVHGMASEARRRWPEIDFTLHFHNTRGMGLANILAGLDAGVRHFDAALGGLGGCPYAPGASGNVCTEEVVHALQLMGYDTGIDLQALLDAAARLPALIGHDMPGQLVKAGPRWKTHPPPADLAEIRQRALEK
ncbi:hydroxymethylglutaryl-CoA lyase [Corticibacter populi]|uniref:Hydroxymethylglutaryl-CoA lyase n=1 Tax=Corticibacter populi TaxID=1550736 RepID=A0A3M6QUE1_9BURK|nr:hydroxymethylglutaryl-CoA lyase [Corticibacter populi]RMX06646.1 hydroxymethylglutaryl-CoA lyase [Corticibacter populi]RZS31782.1 hydroxymethylglutaryl-CoA lyase [Corticibacter populi]